VIRNWLVLWMVCARAWAATIPGNPAAAFEENRGQYPSEILYVSRPDAYVTADRLVFSGSQAAIRFAGADPAARPGAGDPLPGALNVYSGADPQKWITGLRQYSNIQIQKVYPGIDAIFIPGSDNFMYRLRLAPAANPSAVRIEVSNAGDLSLISGQTLTGLRFIQRPPTAWQDLPEGRISIDVHYSLVDATHFTIVPGAYDTSQPLTIEMGLSVLRQLNIVSQVKAAPSGNFYQVTTIPDVITQPIATAGLVQPTAGACSIRNGVVIPCRDVVVTKYSAAGDVLYNTCLRGSADDVAAAVIAGTEDGKERLHLAGETGSADFPVTSNAAQKYMAGAGGDLFVASLDGDTGALIYSTFLGGPQSSETARELHLDGGGDLFVTGAGAAGLPATTHPLTGCAHCSSNFAAKIDTRSGALIYWAYLPDFLTGTAADPAGGFYFTGTYGPDFPTTRGAWQERSSQPSAAFVAKLNPSGTALEYGTYVAVDEALIGGEVAADSQGNAWVTASSQGYGAPPGVKFFLARFDPTGSRRVYYSRFLPADILVESSDNLIVSTLGVNGFQLYSYDTTVRTPGGTLTTACGPSVTKLDAAGNVMVSRVLPPSAAGTDPAAVDLRAGPSAWASCTVNSASMSDAGYVAPGEIVSIVGKGLGPAGGAAFQLDAQGRVPTSLAGTVVRFNGTPIPILYAEDGQVNAVIPFDAATGTAATLEIEYQGRVVAPLTVQVTGTEWGLFTLDGSGAGQALAFNPDGTLNSVSNPAPLGGVMTIFASGLGALTTAAQAGDVAGPELAMAAARVQVRVANQVTPPDTLYVGTSPGSLSSVTQINFRLPTRLAGAPGPAVLTVALDTDQVGFRVGRLVTIAVK
jgi:uncharacterized protein (TIGR03437 family)